jgi:hypothetical protein
MRNILLAAVLALPCVRAFGGEGGERIKVSGKPLHARIAAESGAKAGGVLWTSPTSDKLKASFDKLFFQGVVQNQDIKIQASLLSDQGWGPWVDAELDVSPNGRFWAQIQISGKAGQQVRLRALSATGAHDNAELFGFETAANEGETGGAAGNPRLEAADNGTTAPPPPAQTVAPQAPTVLPRSAWGAKKATKPYEPMLPDRISVHHTEAFQAFSQTDAAQEMRVIQNFHQKGRGWIDIAYHFVIDGSGRIWEGRPVGVVGAHVKNKNDGNIGISLMGDFHAPKNNQPSMAQIQSLVTLLKYLTAKYQIPVSRIKGHRDQEDTSCPGDILYARLDDIRRQTSTGSVAFAVPDATAIDLAFRGLLTQ